MRAIPGILLPIPFVAAVAWLTRPAGVPGDLQSGDARAALAAVLATRGLETTPDEVHFVDPKPTAWGSLFSESRAVLRTRRRGSSWDVSLIRTRRSPEGALLSVGALHDLTNTEVADEQKLEASAIHAAWLIGSESRVYRVELADLRGDTLPAGEKWPLVARLQHAVTSLQRTGQASGVGRRSFKLDPPAARVALHLTADALEIQADDHRISIPFEKGRPIAGERFVLEEDRELAQPGNLVTWAVDRARDLPWFGDERMQLTKAIAYRILDAADRALGTVRAARPHEPELSSASLDAAATDPETGFPPPPIPPLVNPPFTNEGQWMALDRDPFVRTNPDAPPAMVTTYFRGDGSRPDCIVYAVLWDPRQVELDMTPGTEEPQSATGETGTGMIPRKPEIMSRLLGAFNGAFQSTHGDYGMMVDGSVLVPPKPYAATVARLEDGSIGFGTWPETTDIPKDFVSFRQNLTPLVMDGKYNPYGREWWGGVPHDWEDETHTVRSAVCLTHEGFVAYFYAQKIDPVHLGRVLLAARCDYGIHLDMNQGHTGLELYRAFPKGELPSLGKLDGHWQAEDEVLGMPGWQFRGRRLLKNMQLMHFPRYIRRGMRDYFYLLLKPILPGPPVTAFGGEGEEGHWTVHGLPQHGFPPALATTSVRPDASRAETKVRVLRIDPETVTASGGETEKLVATIDAAPAGPVRLWLGGGRAWISETAAGPDARALWSGSRAPLGPVRAAACVSSDGKVVYAEVATAADPERDGPLLAKVLDAVRCKESLFLAGRPSVGIGGAVDPSGHPVRPSSEAVRLTRRTFSGSKRLFPDTKVLPPVTWMPLQRQTRFWPKETDAQASASAAAEAAP